MAGIRSLIALLAAMGSSAAPAADTDLYHARLRASAALVSARDAIEHQRPGDALAALDSAWGELAPVPGGEAFQDLVVLDAASELARDSLAHHDVASARLAMEVALSRIHA